MANLITATLKGVEGKDLDYSNQYSFFLETSLQGTDQSGATVEIPAVAVEALGDPNMSSGRFTTVAFAAVPIQYIDALKEAGINVFPSAPITQIIDLAFTSDNAYAKQCMLAVNKYAMSADFGQEMPVGQFQVCYDKNETFAVGETFKLAMVAELAMGQEIVDMYTDVNSIDDLCTCFDMNSTAADSRVDCATIDEFNNPTEPTEEPTEPTEEPTNPTTTDPCDPNPCEGGATCTADATAENGYTCTPAAPADPCEGVTCEGEEVCNPTTGVCE